MNNLEQQLEERLHQIADGADIHPDLAGVKNGQSRTLANSSADQGRRPSRTAFVAAVAAVVLGAVVVGTVLQKPGTDITSDAAADSPLDDASSTTVPPSDESATALADSLPTFYLRGDDISPLTVSINRWPDTDVSQSAWELKSSYELNAIDPSDDQREGYGLGMFAVPTVEGVADLDDRLAELGSNGTDVESVSVADWDGWRFEADNVFVLFETDKHLVTLSFWPDTDDETMDHVLAAVGDDLAGFQQMATDDRLTSDGSIKPWVLAAVEDPGPELLSLFPPPNATPSDDDSSEVVPDGSIPEGLLTESDLADGTFTYTFARFVDDEPEKLDPDDITDETGCRLLGELIGPLSTFPSQRAVFTGTDGWEFAHGVWDLEAETNAQILDRFRRVGPECAGWDDLSTDEVPAFGQGNFILAAYLAGDQLFYIELENGSTQTGPERLTEILAAAGNR